MQALFKAKKVVRRTTLISGFCVGILAGLFAAQRGVNLNWLLIPLLLICIVFRKRRKAVLVFLCLAGVALGGWRGTVEFAKLQQYKQLYGNKVVVIAAVADDPGYEKERSETTFTVRKVRVHGVSYIGRLQVKVRGSLDIGRGDAVRVTGTLKAVKGTTYQGLLANAEVTVLQKDTSVVEVLRTRFFRAVRAGIPEPRASLALGYLVGVRADLPKALKDQLAIVGLTHIIAVSGYNLTILVQMVRSVFSKRSAYQSVVFSGLLIVGFIVITGASASIVRAAVVSGLSLLTWYYGRTVRPLLLLLLSGTLTAVANPLYVWGDPGWYLSFLAFAGILIVAPLLVRRFFRTKKPGVLMQTCIETCSAQIMTTPYVLYIFGGFSVIAPLANVVVLPLIPYIMLLTFLAGVTGMVSDMLSGLIGMIPSALLSLQVWVIERLSKVPGARLEQTISFASMCVGFLMLALVIYWLGSRKLLKTNESGEIDLNLL